MQLMADAVSVLGSRHGLVMDPVHRTCGLIRFDPWGSQPVVHVRAGVELEGREYTLPLCPDGEAFFFHDQRISPCTMSVMGIDPNTTTKLKLTVATPFRPKDIDYSTRPVLGLRLTVERMPGLFRWVDRTSEPRKVRIFLEVSGPAIRMSASGPDSVDLRVDSCPARSRGDERAAQCFPQVDRLVGLNGRLEGTRFILDVDCVEGVSQSLDVAWCTHSEPVLEVLGQTQPFRYADALPSLDAVADWARQEGRGIFENAVRVDGIVARNNLCRSANNLLAQTLHSWLINTWWVRRGQQEVFTVWEGSCHFHSTVDVEFTQSPFYLAAWPELLGYELDLWPSFALDGSGIAGEAGQGTLYLSHDCGNHARASGQAYNHPMAIEETTNYLILACAHYRRTGDDTYIKRHAQTIEAFLKFIAACDTTGNGVPDVGVANTIDDASPAVQFGREQVYLAVKALSAFVAGQELMELCGRDEVVGLCGTRAAMLREVLEVKGWAGDHFVTLLNSSAKGVVNPWTGETMECDEIPGWDSAHIYTANGLAPLDMVGVDVGLDAQRLKTDLRVATQRCLREYGCVHSEYEETDVSGGKEEMLGLAGRSKSPGWVAMNLLRDVAAFYRGVDLRALADRYWEWQVLTNTQGPALFFETFNGNNLHYYPRGVAAWGMFDALARLVVDKPHGIDRCAPVFPQVRVPRLADADWVAGTCDVMESE